jgi:hypothetical protein
MDWNERATGWVEFETMLEATHAPVLHSLVARAGMMQGARVLDIGGGQDGRAERCGFFDGYRGPHGGTRRRADR